MYVGFKAMPTTIANYYASFNIPLCSDFVFPLLLGIIYDAPFKRWCKFVPIKYVVQNFSELFYN